MKALLQSCLLYGLLAASGNCLQADSESGVTVAAELVRRPVIDSLKLAQLRGGLSVAGLNFTVGAVMRTLVDGNLVLESYVNLGGMTGTGTPHYASNTPAFRATGSTHSSSDLKISQSMKSFVLEDAKGYTQITHDLSQDRFLATIVNYADGRKIQSELDINVTLQNYQSLQAAAIRNRILNSLNNVISP